MKELPACDFWIVRPRPVSAPRLRLICVPCAGRGAALYRGWPELIPREMELCSVQLPGREGRLREAPFLRMSEAVDRAADALYRYLDVPFAFFGHSLGAIFCFELARRLRSRYGIAPVHLFVSARRAPQISDPRLPLHRLPDAGFIAEIRRRYNGLPPEVLASPELMELLLPVLRADVQMLETYAYEPAAPLDCPITAFGGLDDITVKPEDLDGWRRHTTGRFEMKLFPGDHFFIQSVPQEVLKKVQQRLAEPCDPDGQTS